jgi:hypothetical protein
MFTFTTTGKLSGFSTSQDGRMTYLRVTPDVIGGVELQREESPDVLSVAIPSDKLPPGISPGTRIQVEGVGCHAGKKWTNRANGEEKTIHNLRLQASTIKVQR